MNTDFERDDEKRQFVESVAKQRMRPASTANASTRLGYFNEAIWVDCFRNRQEESVVKDCKLI